MTHCATLEPIKEEKAEDAGFLLSPADDMVSIYFLSGSDKSSRRNHCPQSSAVKKIEERKTKKEVDLFYE